MNAKQCIAKARQAAFVQWCRSRGLPEPTPEYRFDAERRWRFDWAWPACLVSLEQEGGVWSGGRHTRGAGYVKDMEKYSEAAAQGWRIIRVQPKDLMTERTHDWLARAMRRPQCP
jgi:hypothetical protein